MTENKELGDVNFENQEERSDDDGHKCETQKHYSKLPFAYILENRISFDIDTL